MSPPWPNATPGNNAQSAPADAQVDRALKRIGNYDDLVGGGKSDDAGGGRRIAVTASA